jgi:hypothetical protein
VEEALGRMAILGRGGREGRALEMPSWTEEMGVKKNFSMRAGGISSE